jgi:hypothetical protein
MSSPEEPWWRVTRTWYVQADTGADAVLEATPGGHCDISVIRMSEAEVIKAKADLSNAAMRWHE